jgi:hypothetical protein
VAQASSLCAAPQDAGAAKNFPEQSLMSHWLSQNHEKGWWGGRLARQVGAQCAPYSTQARRLRHGETPAPPRPRNFSEQEDFLPGLHQP